MSLAENEFKLLELEHELEKLKRDEQKHPYQIKDLEINIADLKKQTYQNLSAYDRVYLARKQSRAHMKDYIRFLFDDFIEMHGDRLYKDDHSMLGGIAMFCHMPVTVIGHVKGTNLTENMDCNFGIGDYDNDSVQHHLKPVKIFLVILYHCAFPMYFDITSCLRHDRSGAV